MRAWQASRLGGRQGRGPRQGPAVGAGPARRTSPEPGLPAGRRCVGPAAPGRGGGRASGPLCGRGSRGAVSRGIYGGGGGQAGGRLPAGEQRAGPEGAPPAQAWALARPLSEAGPDRAWGRNPLLFCSRGVGRRCLLPCWGPGLPAAFHTRPVGRGERTSGGESCPTAGNEALAGLSPPRPHILVQQTFSCSTAGAHGVSVVLKAP